MIVRWQCLSPISPTFPLSSALIPAMCFNVTSFSSSALFSFYPHPAACTMEPFPRTETKDCKGCDRVNESILKRGSRFLLRSLLCSLSSRSLGNASNTLRKESRYARRKIQLDSAQRSSLRISLLKYRPSNVDTVARSAFGIYDIQKNGHNSFVIVETYRISLFLRQARGENARRDETLRNRVMI